jgi:hypothetical protein
MGEHDSRELFGARRQREGKVKISFDLTNRQEREMYEWYTEQAGEGETFIKQVLSQYKEYQNFMQMVSKLHEMMPMMQQMFTPGAGQPLQQLSSQVNTSNSTISHIQPFSQPTTKATNSASSAIPSRSVRHGSKRRRTSMPME